MTEPVAMDLRYPCMATHSRRLRYYAIQAVNFLRICHRRIEITGIPADATFVRAFYDERVESFYLVYEHPSFEEVLEGVMPMPHAFLCTEFHDG